MRTSQNICAYQNICLHVKYSLTSKIFAPYLKYLHMYKIYAPHLKCSRLIIYDSNKAAVEIFAPYERCIRPENRRPNSYYNVLSGGLETSSGARKPGMEVQEPVWRSVFTYITFLGSAESPTSDSFSVWLKSSCSGDVVSPPCSPQVGSAPRPPSLYGRRLCRTVPAVEPARPAKIFAPCPNVPGRKYSHLFPGKNQKPNSAHKCPSTSIQIRT